MIGIVIVTHGNLGKEFIVALEHVVGSQTDIEAICINPDDDMEKSRKKILTSIKKVNSGQGVIVATDMFGGTPSNLAISTLKENQTEVIAGVNLPMLIKMVSSRKDLKLSELIKVSQDSGRKYINVASAFFGESKS
ncbi:MAG: PTS fructose transporter subunit IIA [Rickettsiales bacterium]|nr:PTS fructose transporter subunit IIA [Rickettsiales bacterium]OUV54085.1 MAG: PTS fructose transporter subunit IIA [Rickettsiales bacterium TMED127]|tara:strand:- start:4071 stop:4478 length:408 start_codon:yes stop_codon:yes gene_type:complete